MTCDKIMLKNPQTVGTNATVPDAVKLMKEYGIRSLPVVDSKGNFIGVFTTTHLIKLLLPAVATIEDGLSDLSFVHDPISYIQRRYKEVTTHRVGDFIDVDDVPFAHPDTSMTEVMLLLYKHRTHITVIDPESRAVVGVVTVNSVLETLEKG